MTPPSIPEPGWYQADGDPEGTHRYWNGEAWVGEPQPLPASVTDADPRIPAGLTLASPTQRILARLLDVVLLAGIFILARFLIDDDIGDGASRLSLVVGLVTGVIYEVGMVAAVGATVGKLVVGTRIVTADGTTPPPIGVAGLRWLPNAISVVPFAGPLISLAIILASLLWVFTDPRRRTIYDRAATTYVVTGR
ncbi:MAG: RDD family protein [Actinomycetota bacterium]